MPNFTAGTSFTDGVTNDVTAAKLNALIADAVPTSSLSLNSTTGTISQFSSGTGTAASPAIQPTGDTNTGIFFPAADTIAFSEGGTESMRIDSSGNVGIGTNSPQTPLHIASSSATIRIQDSDTVGNGSNSLAAYVQFRDSSATQIGYVGFGGEANFSLWNQQNSNLLFATNNTERLRIDSSGNVLVNTAANDTGAKLEVKQSASGTGFGIQAQGNDNAKIQFRLASGSTGVGGEIASNGGIVISPSNTERLRIDSSGNVGIGTTSPGTYKLNVNGTSNFSGDLNIASSSNLYWNGGDVAITSSSTNLIFKTYSGVTLSERMRIDSSGRVGIGTSSPAIAYRMSLTGDGSTIVGGLSLVSGGTTYIGAISSTSSDFEIFNASNGYVRIATNNTERLRITSAGEVYIAGTTDQGAYNLQVNGTGVWGAGAYVNGSDERLKENIQDITSGLDVVEKLRPVSFQYKENYTADRSVQSGFIAQDLLVALEGKNYLEGVVSQGPTYYNVAYQNLIPILAKAIQELKAENDSLKARIEILEAA